MQITLVQAEIEAALRAYINDQIVVKEGMQINIDLSAGRGADGFKAMIDIVPEGQVATTTSTPVAAAQNAPVKGTVTQASRPSITRSEPKEVVKAAVQTQPEPVVPLEPQTEAAAQDVFTETEVADNASPVEDVQVEAPPVIEKPRALFGGLKAPKNS